MQQLLKADVTDIEPMINSLETVAARYLPLDQHIVDTLTKTQVVLYVIYYTYIQPKHRPLLYSKQTTICLALKIEQWGKP